MVPYSGLDNIVTGTVILWDFIVTYLKRFFLAGPFREGSLSYMQNATVSLFCNGWEHRTYKTGSGDWLIP